MHLDLPVIWFFFSPLYIIVLLGSLVNFAFLYEHRERRLDARSTLSFIRYTK
jgi:hypothetical protein